MIALAKENDPKLVCTEMSMARYEGEHFVMFQIRTHDTWKNTAEGHAALDNAIAVLKDSIPGLLGGKVYINQDKKDTNNDHASFSIKCTTAAMAANWYGQLPSIISERAGAIISTDREMFM